MNLSWKVKKCKDKRMQIYWILNKVQKNTEFNKRNWNFSLQEIMRSENQISDKDANQICKKWNMWNDKYTL